MKTNNVGGIIAAMVLLGVLHVKLAAADIKLAWDASLSAGVTNYVLYAHTNSFPVANRSTALVRINVGTNLTARVEALGAGQWSFAASAMLDGTESDLSNILVVQIPRPPMMLRTVIVQYTDVFTNLYDVGFMRLRLP